MVDDTRNLVYMRAGVSSPPSTLRLHPSRPPCTGVTAGHALFTAGLACRAGWQGGVVVVAVNQVLPPDAGGELEAGAGQQQASASKECGGFIHAVHGEVGRHVTVASCVGVGGVRTLVL